MKSIFKDSNLLFIGFVALMTSFVSMACELLLARFLTSLTSESVVSQSLTFGTYLASLGLGAALSTSIKVEKTKLQLILIEAGLAFLIACSPFLLLFLQLKFQFFVSSWIPKNYVFIFLAQIATLFLGTLAGFEIPLLVRLCPAKENSFGYILGLSYIGGLLGNLSLNFILVPWFGNLQAGLILAFMAASVSAIIYLSEFLNRSHWSSVAVVFSFVIPMALQIKSSGLQQFYLKSFYYAGPAEWSWSGIASTVQTHRHLPDVQRVSSLYQEIDLVQNEQHFQQIPGEFYLFIDQKMQNGPQNIQIYHDLMVHGSFNLAAKKIQSVLIIGGGDGILAKELLKYPQIESIQIVELDSTIIQLGKNHPGFLKWNQNALSDPKVHVEVGDGYEWVRNSKRVFDAILVDLPLPFSMEISRLYSKEFYHFVSERLNPDGFMVFDFPFYGVLKEGEGNLKSLHFAASLLGAVRSAGFKSLQAYGFYESFLLARKGSADSTFNYPELSKWIADVSVSEMSFVDLNSILNLSVEDNSIFKPRWLERVPAKK